MVRIDYYRTDVTGRDWNQGSPRRKLILNKEKIKSEIVKHTGDLCK